MNQGRLIAGSICLALATVLGALYFALPDESFMFTVGDKNLPWLPVVILVVVGIILVATAFRLEKETG
jgi:hypothetical protein